MRKMFDIVHNRRKAFAIVDQVALDAQGARRVLRGGSFHANLQMEQIYLHWIVTYDDYAKFSIVKAPMSNSELLQADVIVM